MPDFTFDPGLVFDDTTLTPSVSATGVLLDVAGGTPQQVYDLQGNQLDTLTTNNRGYVARFKADIGFGVVSFGSVIQPVVSIEVLQSGPAAAAAAASAAAAAADAARAASRANEAATAASQSLTAVRDFIAGQEGGGVPGGGSAVLPKDVIYQIPISRGSRLLSDGTPPPAGVQVFIIGGSTRPVWSDPTDVHLVGA